VVFWDACAVIYFVEGASPWVDRLVTLLDRLDRQHTGHVVSELSLLECRIKPLREQDAATLALYERFFTRRDLIHMPVSREIVLEAARLRAALGLKTPDALQAATALSLPGEVAFLTNDRAFARVPGLTPELIG